MDTKKHNTRISSTSALLSLNSSYESLNTSKDGIVARNRGVELDSPRSGS